MSPVGSWKRSGPLVVGGVGGSGTRVVAEILMALGLHMGSDLNEALDNLWFTMLFKRPAWLKSGRAQKEVDKACAIMEKAMTGRLVPLPSEIAFILRAAAEISRSGHDALGSGRGFWPWKRAARLVFHGRREPSGCTGWGWKEPNSHIYLERLSGFFPALRFIYVMRHGLDMAYSPNRTQMLTWGWLYGVEAQEAQQEMPKASLEYWIRASEKAIRRGRELLGERFLVVNYDALCRNPAVGVEEIARFAGTSPPGGVLERLAGMPRTPASAGRYLGEDLSIFDPSQLRVVERLGFSIERPARPTG